MFQAFDLTIFLIISAAHCVVLFQSKKNQMIVPSSPSWLIALMSPATFLVMVPIAFSVWYVRMAYVYGVFNWNVVGLIFAGFICYAYNAFLHKGAKVSLSMPKPNMAWWIDTRGNLHPHLKSQKSADVTSFSQKKEFARGLLADIEGVGPIGKPVVVKTPFKLEYLSASLSKQGWQIERCPATRCPWIVRIALLYRRGKFKRPSRINWWNLSKMLPSSTDWRDVALVHHAVFYPPGYPLVVDQQVPITQLASTLLKD